MYQALKSSYHLLEERAAQDETLQNSTSDCAHSPLSTSGLQLSSWQDLSSHLEESLSLCFYYIG